MSINIGEQQKVIIQGFKDGRVFEANTVSTQIIQNANYIESRSMDGSFNILPTQTTTEIHLVCIGDMQFGYNDYMTSFRTGEIWRCAYCTCENPKRARLHTWEDMREITSCLKCGAPRHIAYG